MPIFSNMKRFWNFFRQPWVLCILLGPLLFIIYVRTLDRLDQDQRQITISQVEIGSLEEAYARTWNRRPTQEELEGQIDGLVMNEIFYREAVALGLDKTDPSVKQRLRQVMEMMLDEYATLIPAEDQLRSYLANNPEKFRRDHELSFTQLHFAVEEREEALRFLERLERDESAIDSYEGGLIMLPDTWEGDPMYKISNRFGPDFSRLLDETEVGKWSGPYASPYGWHLVRVHQRIEGIVPELEEIWDLVEREWSLERKEEIKEEQYAVLREQYHISIEE